MRVCISFRMLRLSAVLLLMQGVIGVVHADTMPSYTVMDLGNSSFVNGQFVDQIAVGEDYLPRFDASGNVTRYLDEFLPSPGGPGSGNSSVYVQTYVAGHYATGSTWPDATGTSSAYVTVDGNARFIGNNLDPFGVNQQGIAVGATGQPVGYIPFGFSPQAFVHSPTDGLQLLGTLGGASSWAYAINDSNQIVGTSQLATNSATGSPNFAAFVMVDRAMVDLNTLIPSSSGWNLISASDINARGEILGEGINALGERDYFLLIPKNTPEPTSLLGFAIPLAYLAIQHRRRRSRKR